MGLFSEFQSWVVRNMGIMKAQMKQIQETLDAMLHKSNDAIDSTAAFEVEDDSLQEYLPVSNDESLAKVEEKLMDTLTRKKLVHK